ncbi:hypothetical protein [Streptomyces nigra]|uniref:hypothetical protein n=1 Tax=Streptomyces nigra TaxID=1827580 RepID=UPI00344A40AA
MELTPERALEQAQAWLAEPHRLYRTLAVRGVPGSGKTAFLGELAARIPGAVHVDCRGRGADDIARDLLRAWGVTDAPVSLLSGAQRMRSGGVALLSDVQGAGAFVTSAEAGRSALLGHFGLVDNNAQDFWEEPDRTVLEERLEPQAVQRLDATTEVPPGLRDAEARHLLSDVGLPAFTSAEMSLVAVAEEGLAELTAEEVWGEDDGSGAYYPLEPGCTAVSSSTATAAPCTASLQRARRTTRTPRWPPPSGSS